MLRFFTSTFTACALAGTITVFAQEPAPSKPQQQPAPASATLTGCVQELKTTDGGTAFVLNDAAGGNAKLYVLIGQTPADVASHVNHKVEVTGQVHEPNPPPAADVMYRQNLSFVDSSPELGQVFPGFPIDVPTLE